MLIKIIIALALFYLLAMVAIYFAQTWFIYAPNMPSRDMLSSPADINLFYEELTLETEDGEELIAWYVPAKGADKTVLFLHGNAGNISHRLETIKVFHQLGLNFFILDYRGFGQSTGSPGEKGTNIDASTAWKYLLEQKGLNAEQIIIVGRSLGGGVATELAKNVNAAMLILDSTFISMPAVAQIHFPFMPTNWIVKHRYENLRKIDQINMPVVIAHSKKDEVIPYAHAEKIFDAANEPKSFIQLKGGHGNSFLMAREDYVKGIKEALEKFI